MKQALYYKPLRNKTVQCGLCPRFCTLPPGSLGFCGARKNIDGTLFSLNYAKPVCIAPDPIEKKPLFHFLPGSAVLSFGTYGCNLSCSNCQNYDISMIRDRQPAQEVPPEEMIELALTNNCRGLAYTYNEPTIFFEYLLDCARLAKKHNLRNILVSNGFISPEPLRKLCRHIDAANIDLKSIEGSFYKTNCLGRLEPVLDSLKTIKESKVWLEITNLIIPTLNDNPKKLEDLSEWISKNLGKDTPLHLSRFSPNYKLETLPQTPQKTLEQAKALADRHLNYVYVGNLHAKSLENTLCPSCKKLLIRRESYTIQENNLKNGNCKFCGHKIAGVWQ
jgi:pyruvate formate lyase activating enzyme